MGPLKILCLHGYRQNGDYFYEKTGAFRKALKGLAIFDERGEGLAWWFSQSNNTFSSTDATDIDTGFQKSVDLIVKLVKDKGPYDGIMGFSQGASFAVLLASLRAMKKIDLDFSFLILFSGFQSLCSKHAELMAAKLTGIYSLHVYGKNDQVVDFHMSEKLVSMFDPDKCDVIIHEGGHYVPPMGKYKALMIDFLSKVPHSSL
uniref:FSH1 domain-containing protein n=1 Tax=Syphacia muris TaxID=451379 RepID=A0A0N5B0E6_9BILA